MKIIIPTVFVAILLFTTPVVKAEFPLQPTDTTLLSETKSETPTEIVTVIPSNVLFPSSLENNREQSLEYIHKFSEKKKEYLVNTYKKGKKIFPKITAILKRYGLPEELKVLIALESGFNANALSKAGAFGYWQIMDNVAKEYGLKIVTAEEKLSNPKKKDERTNFAKSTLAAARYLKDRCKNLDNDLLLIVAAYNWGVGNIWNAMGRCGKAKPTFWDIKKYLPAETRNYVMNFITLNVIFNNFDKFSKNTLVFNPKTKVIINPGIPAEPEVLVTLPAMQ